MKLPFGFSLTRKAIPAGFQTVERSRGWWPIHEGFMGAWQRNIVTSMEDVLSFSPVYACITLKANDIAKLRIKLVERDGDGVWVETNNTAYSPVLRKPNHFQTRIQFIEHWMLSKFIHGNAYILKQRDNRGGVNRGNVAAMYVLDPTRVSVVVAPDGSVYYRLSVDPLSQTEYAITVPASEIIHDMMPTLYHPLCGVSPLKACDLAAMLGLKAQRQSLQFFEHGSTPSGTVSMPDEIDDQQARDIQKRWEEQFSGNNAGRVAVLGFGMKYERMTMTAVEAQLSEQLKWTAEQVCTAHHVPPFMIGVGPMPTYNNIEALNQQYYSQALQIHIESMEILLDEGLGMAEGIGTEMDLDGLIRMDTVSKMTAAGNAIKSGMSPNEVRLRFFDLGKVKGGESPYFQQQDYSLEALSKRDAQEDPFASKKPPTPDTPAPPEPKAVDRALLIKTFTEGLEEAA
jgi:HK97 family phage portal protein